MADTGDIAPRKPAVAAVLAFFCIGLGHVYAGRGRTGLALQLLANVAFTGAVTLALLLLTHAAAWALLVILAAFGAVWLTQVVLAARAAQRAGEDFRLKRYNHVGAYVAFYVAALLLGQLVLKPLRNAVAEPFRAASSSMSPTLLEGDQFASRKVGAQKVERGAVVTYRPPGEGPPRREKRKVFVGRVVGVPGDSVSFDGEALAINGVSTSRAPCASPHVTDCRTEAIATGVSWQIALDSEPPPLKGEVTVPEGHVFILGDNRNNAYDSRSFGPVPIERLTGRAAAIFLSFDPGQWDLRLERIGTRL